MAEQRIKVSKGQVELLGAAIKAQETVQNEAKLVFSTILAGADLKLATLRSIDAEASEIVIEVPDIAPKDEAVA